MKRRLKKLKNSLKKIPFRNKKKSKFEIFLNKIIYLVGILGPIMTLPQVLKIFLDKNAAGVSAISWGFYFLFSGIWLMYGIVNKEKPIIVTYSFWVLFDLLVFIGALIY